MQRRHEEQTIMSIPVGNPRILPEANRTSVADRGRRAGGLCQKSVAEILEIDGDTEVTAPHKLTRLQVVFLFRRRELSILQLALHFESSDLIV